MKVRRCGCRRRRRAYVRDITLYTFTPTDRAMRLERLLPNVGFVAVAVTLASVDVANAQAQPSRWRGTVDLTIGGADADDDASFGSVSGIAIDGQGRVFVADRQDNQIRVFSATGVFQSRIGRVGSGPLEFKRLATIGFGPDRLLWARDEGNARMLGIDVSASPARGVRNVPLQQFTGGSRLPITFEAEGRLVDESIYFEPASESFRQTRLVRNLQGSVIRTDTLKVPPGADAGVHKITRVQKDASGKQIGMSQGFLWQPFGPQWLRAYGPSGLRAEVVSSRYEVTVFSADGRTLRTLKRSVPPVALSARERRVADSTLREVKSDLPFGVPSAKAPIVGLFWSTDGSLWVERAVPDGAARSTDVYDRAGRLIALAEWPREIDVFNGYPAITGTTAHVVSRDADGIESVVRLRFR